MKKQDGLHNEFNKDNKEAILWIIIDIIAVKANEKWFTFDRDDNVIEEYLINDKPTLSVKYSDWKRIEKYYSRLEKIIAEIDEYADELFYLIIEKNDTTRTRKPPKETRNL